MNARNTICAILCLALVLGSTSTGRGAWNKVEAKVSSESVKTAKTHLGGCILTSPAAEPPANLYQESEIIPTDEYKPFTKKLSVYGITLIGRDDISDDFMRRVAKTIKEMFPQNGTTDSELQKEVLRNLYRYKALIPLFRGKEHKFAPSDEAAWRVTKSRNSSCDIIMEGVPGQVNEVVEHILHHVTDVGLQNTFPDEWGISKSSKLYQAMQEAIDKKYYDIRQYDRFKDSEVWNRVLLQEFAYWIIYTSWDLRETYGPKEAEWTIMNSAELKSKLPRSYELFEATIPRIMISPSRSTLEEFIK